MMIDTMTPLEREVGGVIIESLNLADVTLLDINPEAVLFKGGLGLDSIDALELSMALSVRYGLQIRSDDPNNKGIFSSLRALALHVQANRKN